METTLHRQLKEHYAGKQAKVEVVIGDYRIDAVVDNVLVEVQQSGLSAIRRKIGVLLEKFPDYNVLVVKPIIQRKMLVKLDGKEGEVISKRRSPKRGTPLDIFNDMIHFMKVFPHPRLTIEAPLVEIEEWRYPGHGKRRRRRESDFQVADQQLVEMVGEFHLRSARDLAEMVDCRLPAPFDTADLAEGLEIRRHLARRIAYCLREAGEFIEVGKKGNARLYESAKAA